MAAPLVKTRTPGIFKRGSRYVFSYHEILGTYHRSVGRDLGGPIVQLVHVVEEDQ